MFAGGNQTQPLVCTERFVKIVKSRTPILLEYNEIEALYFNALSKRVPQSFKHQRKLNFFHKRS